jgi:hypothetical protein
MGAYARSIGFCAKNMGGNGNAVWFSCEHLHANAMDVLNGTGLLFFSGGKGGHAYAIQTCDSAYAQELTNELAGSNFKVLRTVPTGALYTSPKFKGLELMCTAKPVPVNGKEATSWAFMVLMK